MFRITVIGPGDSILTLNCLQVGQALAESKVPRKDIWLTSKLWNSYHEPHQVEPILNETLESLGVSYLDLYLYV